MAGSAMETAVVSSPHKKNERQIELKTRIGLRLYDFELVCKKECVLAEGAMVCLKLEAEETIATYTAAYIASTIHPHNAQIPAKCRGRSLKMLHNFVFITGVEAAAKAAKFSNCHLLNTFHPARDIERVRRNQLIPTLLLCREEKQ